MLPDSFVQRMQMQLPTDEWEAFLIALQTDPIVSVRANPAKITSLPGESVPWHPHGRYLETRPRFVEDPLFHAGAYYVQEASSMLVHAMLPAMDRPMRILDLCAAPGGKSSLVAAAMSSDSVLVSNEVIFSRAKTLAENMTRWGNPNVIVTHADPREFSQLVGMFDLILVDAPCSGEGMFRKDAGAIDEWSEENVAICAARQERILADVMPALAPGGSIIYSTCTYAESENGQRVASLLEQYPSLRPAPADFPESWGAAPVLMYEDKAYAYQCYPHRLKGEGLFITRLQDMREPETWEASSSPSFSSSKSKQRKGKKPKRRSNKSRPSQDSVVNIPELLQLWLGEHSETLGLKAEVHEEMLKVFTAPVSNTFPALQQNRIHIIQAGITVGKLHRKGLNPSHELALSSLVTTQAPVLPLTLEQALRYLKKEDLPDSDAAIGFHLAQYKDVNLGWVKGISGRWKNYLPINWRIRTNIS
ncbi:MAG: hypothetical protein AB8F95_09505 [Bacteroidia bacterium]